MFTCFVLIWESEKKASWREAERWIATHVYTPFVHLALA